MGSDFLLAMVEYPKDFDQVRRRIDKLPDTRCWILAEVLWAWDEHDIEQAGGPTLAAQSVRNYLHDALDLLASPPRDMSIHEIEGKEWAFTGGMTPGDDPTESWQFIIALSEADVCHYQDPTGQRQ